jgi:hypothetical protein
VVDTAKVKSYLLDESNAVRELYLLSMKRIEPTIKAQAIWDSTQSKFQAMADSISGLPINQ